MRDAGQITIRELLAHRAGLFDYTSDPALLREERRHFFGHVPVARALFRGRWRAQVLGQVEGEPADECAIAAVDLDRRGDGVAGQGGGLPDLERQVGTGVERRARKVVPARFSKVSQPTCRAQPSSRPRSMPGVL